MCHKCLYSAVTFNLKLEFPWKKLNLEEFLFRKYNITSISQSQSILRGNPPASPNSGAPRAREARAWAEPHC